jgi:large subunit ribosomal protein L2
MYRNVDFYRKKFDIEATVERVEYDPNRSCYIMLVKFDDGTHAYYLAPQKIKTGDKIINGSKKEIKVGNCMPLQDIPVGINIHNVEIQPGGGGKIARSAGTSVTISGLDGNYSLIKLASGEVRKIDSRSLATIGTLSNPDQKNIKIGKAGRSRWLGRRPHTRGVVKNPVDHPHGGGEGKSAGGRHPVSPTGQSAKGLKTRDNKRTDKFIVKRRNKRKDTK